MRTYFKSPSWPKRIVDPHFDCEPCYLADVQQVLNVSQGRGPHEPHLGKLTWTSCGQTDRFRNPAVMSPDLNSQLGRAPAGAAA